MSNILFEKNSSTGLCMSIMLLLLSGFLLYGLYKRYYELRINAHLRTPNKRIHLVSIRTVMRIWGITAILLLCAYTGFFYLAPESDNDPVIHTMVYAITAQGMMISENSWKL